MSPRRVVVVAYEAAELLEIACVTTALVNANYYAEVPLYEATVATPGGNPITCSSGLVLPAQQTLERVNGPLDTIIVVGGIGSWDAAENRLLLAHIRRLARESRRVASVCTGSSVLAAAGLLTGRRVTTHWQWARDLAVRHPEVTVDPDPIFIRDGNVYTAAGVTSALDLTLAFIEEDNDADLARQVARGLVTYLQRPGNQAQMSIFTQAPPCEDRLVRQIIDHVTTNLDGDLAAGTLAMRAGVSERHLTRLFFKNLGQTPGRFVRQVRTEAAAHLLGSTTLPLASVAARCGFGTAETLRQAFVDRYGIPPSRYRLTQRSA
ncbi:GlxA family transcriptional regulator [Nonomuraea rhizosphaerae]|uniref:GlxA family transcriptional regulator n=1 Tax=Nonomuraea rhizosphaerae TaxID=2665663 RepID=UPI001C60175E|nr:GlxA family transcriptional regulator [Nonomuraea rhizosphaerae]